TALPISLPSMVSMTCSELSHPAANVLLPTTAGVPSTGPPGTLKRQRSLPWRLRQNNVSSPEPKRTESPAQLAPEVTSDSVSNVHNFLPVAASTQWKTPSASPT